MLIGIPSFRVDDSGVAKRSAKVTGPRVEVNPEKRMRPQHLVRRSGPLGQHVPHHVRSKVYEDCTANTNAEIPRGTRNADQRIEGNHPDPREGWNLVEPPKEEHRRRR